MKIQRGTSLGRWRDRHEPVPLSNVRYRTDTNVCGQPKSLQIRSHVWKLGERAPASSFRYSRTVTPRCHAAGAERPARLSPVLLEHLRSIAIEDRRPSTGK
jgi:hypothetical protein